MLGRNWGNGSCPWRLHCFAIAFFYSILLRPRWLWYYTDKSCCRCYCSWNFLIWWPISCIWVFSLEGIIGRVWPALQSCKQCRIWGNWCCYIMFPKRLVYIFEDSFNHMQMSLFDTSKQTTLFPLNKVFLWFGFRVWKTNWTKYYVPLVNLRPVVCLLLLLRKI